MHTAGTLHAHTHHPPPPIFHVPACQVRVWRLADTNPNPNPTPHPHPHPNPNPHPHPNPNQVRVWRLADSVRECVHCVDFPAPLSCMPRTPPTPD
eukprot:scaffold27583_cov33-Phaeocystis_antarctica.AAC.1